MVENPNDTVPLTDDKLLIFFNDDFLLKLFETIELAAYSIHILYTIWLSCFLRLEIIS